MSYDTIPTDEQMQEFIEDFIDNYHACIYRTSMYDEIYPATYGRFSNKRRRIIQAIMKAAPSLNNNDEMTRLDREIKSITDKASRARIAFYKRCEEINKEVEALMQEKGDVMRTIFLTHGMILDKRKS